MNTNINPPAVTERRNRIELDAAKHPLSANDVDQLRSPGMAGHRRIELFSEDTGRWMVETISGSRHVFDLDEMTYRRYADEPLHAEGLDQDSEETILEIELLPRINSTFRVATASSVPGHEHAITSSYVVRITPLGDDEEPYDTAQLSVLEEVAQAPPTNAWLLMGDDASFPSQSELRAQRDLDDPIPLEWTCPPQIQRGDLVFVYFMAPRKAVHFAARALEAPVYDPTIEVNALKTIDAHQWWTDLGPLVEVPPVSFQRLKDLNGGYLNLRGKPRTYLTPDVVDQIVAGFEELDDEQRLVLQRPVGDPNLPDPSKVNLADLRQLAAGRLSPETMVEEYVAKPLLRLCFAEEAGYRVIPQVRIPGAGVADFGVYDSTSSNLIGVVEVKIGVRRRPGGELEGSPDLAQVLRYAGAADVPGLLIDANDIFLVEAGASGVVGSYQRDRLTSNHLDVISTHIHR